MVQDETHFPGPPLYQAVILAGSAFVEQRTAVKDPCPITEVPAVDTVGAGQNEFSFKPKRSLGTKLGAGQD